MLINDILDITRIESGNQVVRRAVTPLLDLLSEVFHLLKFRVEEKGLQFNVLFDGKVPKAIYSDGMRLRQILINLLGNATKFTDQGEVRLTVRFEPQRRLSFIVSDTGCGIDPDYVDKLFTPFAQEEMGAARRHGGTGLGLALSKRLAQDLGGNLRLLTSTPGVGSAFVADVDVGNIEESSLVEGRIREHLQPVPVGQSGEKELSLQGMRILLVDDSAEIRALVSFYLSKAQAEVVAVADGLQALADIEARKFDAVLMDVRMPGMDGYETLSRVRQRGSKVPVVALTANAMAEEREKCLAAGFNGFLTKPIDPDLLRRECARLKGICPSENGSPDSGYHMSRRSAAFRSRDSFPFSRKSSRNDKGNGGSGFQPGYRWA